MSVRVDAVHINIVPVAELPEGVLAEIVLWADSAMYRGSVVQWYGDDLVRVGRRMEESWPHSKDAFRNRKDLLVRILPDDTTLTVYDNREGANVRQSF